MNETINVSVIVPIFGVEKYIERCARSLFEQTMKEGIEFIFVDDCTLDNSIEVLNSTLKGYPNRQSQVKILKHERNKGLPQARKTGVLVATGEYISHCDSDDWVDLDMYRKLYEKAKKEDADIVTCDMFKSDGEKNIQKTLSPGKGLLCGPVWNKLVRRALYFDNEITYPTAGKGEDGALMVQLSYYAKKIVHLSEPLYYYFSNPDSICRVMTEEAMLKRLKEEIENTDLRIDFLKHNHCFEEKHNEVIRWKKACRDNLYPFFKDRKYQRMWRDTYPEINCQFILDPSNSAHAKINFLMDYLGLHNFWIEVKNRFYK